LFISDGRLRTSTWTHGDLLGSTVVQHNASCFVTRRTEQAA
jgi:hypothetical protein